MKQSKKNIIVIADNSEIICYFFMRNSKGKVKVEMSRLKGTSENAIYTLIPLSYDVPLSRYAGLDVDEIWVIEPVLKNLRYHEFLEAMQERPPYRYFKENTVKHFKIA
jgi:hypothetical protein